MKMHPTRPGQGSTDSYQPSLTMRMDSQTSTPKSSNTEAEQGLSDPAGRGSKPAGNEVGKESRTKREETEGTGSHNFSGSNPELTILNPFGKNRDFVVLRAGFEPATSLTLSITREANILSASRDLTGLYSVA